MPRQHHYETQLEWTGNRGTGTSGYRDYARDHEISSPGKGTVIPGSSDPTFRGDGARYNPEELFVGALSACHMLWFLHLCADAGIVVTGYSDHAVGTMLESTDGGGEVTSVELRPEVELQDASRAAELDALHHRAHELCFLARSVKTEVRVKGKVAPIVKTEAK
jgi:organic hydroperoxide reductase OsmC/OhrA